MSWQPDINKTYLYTKDPYEAKYQFLINKRKSTRLKSILIILKLLFNPNKKRKILIVFGDMIVDILSKKKPNPIVPELFIRGRKLNISVVFITQPYFD